MDISELKQELLQGKLRPFYVFTGDELALQDVYIDKIQKLSGMQMIRAESLGAIYTKLTAKSLIKTSPCLYVIRNDEVYHKAETSWDKFIKAKSLKDNIVIMLYSGVEKSSKFVKHHDEVCTQFDYIGESILRNRLQATTGMPIQYCDDIVKLCGCNYGRIKNEIAKLYTFGRANNFSINNAYLEGKKQNLIHEDIGDVIFDYTNAVIERNIPKAYAMYDKVIQTDDGPMRLISVLYNSFRQILMVQSTEPKQRTEEVLGMTKGQIYVTSQKCGIYNLFELVDIVKTLRYLEKGIKIGIVEEAFALPYLMGMIW